MVNLEGAAAACVAAPSPCAVTIAPASSTGTAAASAIKKRFTSDLLGFSRLDRSVPRLWDLWACAIAGFSVPLQVFPCRFLTPRRCSRGGSGNRQTSTVIRALLFDFDGLIVDTETPSY